MHAHLHRAIFKADLLARQGHGAGFGALACRQHFKTHFAAFRPLDFCYHVVETPADHIFHRLARLTDADDAVADADRFALRRRTARDHRVDHRVVVIHLQYRADAFQRQAHFGVELFGIARRQIVGVRIDFVREGVHRQLEHIFAVALRQAANSEVIAFGQHIANFFFIFASQLQAELVILYLGIP